MAIAADTWVETIRGRLRAYQITPDMYVFGRDGLPTRVKSVQTYTPQKMYRVDFSDGSSVEGDSFLAFPAKKFSQRVGHAKKKTDMVTDHRRKLNLRGVEQILEHGVRHPRHERFEFTVDTVKPLQYGYEDHAVPPFVAGMWYAKRTTKNTYVVPEDTLHIVKLMAQHTKQFTVVQKKNHFELRPSVEAMFLKDYAQIPTHEFPYKYLYGQPEQRLEFLQGFFAIRHATYKPDMDMFRVRARKSNRYKLQMIQVLCESLGIRTILSNEGDFWELQFNTKYKLAIHQGPAKRKSGDRHRQIVNVQECHTRPCVHIDTEKPIAVGDSFITIWHLQQDKTKS